MAAHPPTSPVCISGIMPELSMAADLGPPRSELGVGGLMPWAGKLYVVTYVSHRMRSGTHRSLYVIDEHFRSTAHPASVSGTYANRMVHQESNQLILGPHVIDAQHQVRTVHPLIHVRLAAVMRHLVDPERKVYVLGMEGEFFELDLYSLAVKKLFDLTKILDTPGEGRVHFKAGYTAMGKVVVTDNTYDEKDFKGQAADGRLAEWDGKHWTILERKPFVEVSGRGEFGGTIFATGWDRASAILKVYTHADRVWRTYRLPKASHTFDHMWQTEWPRIREVEHERLLMDCHGMFYELSPWAYGNRVWGIRPISSHLGVIPDFCSWRGLLVMGSDNASPSHGKNVLTAEPQSGLWMGKTDDLWHFGKAAGWGGPWWQEDIRAHVTSDPYLMTGFDKKVLHLTQDGTKTVEFHIEVDFLGSGVWVTYDRIKVARGGYVHHEFPAGFSAHWIRFTTNRKCTATAYLHYT